VRAFAKVLYFNTLADVVGKREKDLSAGGNRALGLFMLAQWHGHAPGAPSRTQLLLLECRPPHPPPGYAAAAATASPQS
jgi:hypothetical protein